MSEQNGWSAWETLGLGIPNPRAAVRLPLTPEILEMLEQNAARAGLTVTEYFDRILAEFNSKEEQNNG